MRDFLEIIGMEVEHISPSDYRSALDRDRPYNGQPHTDTGKRGETELEGITMRDVRDAFIIAAFACAGNQFDFDESRYGSVYGIDWNQIDPIALTQNLTCELEKRMGIYPNVEEIRKEEV